MAVLASLFGNAPEQQGQDSDKLLNLFWNRTELKKEFANLRKEQYRLGDKIKLQEGEIARATRKLANLESLLMNPEWACNAVVHYQLRGLAQRCENKLAKYAEQLKQQCESKRRNSVLVSWNDERLRQRARVEKRLAEIQQDMRGLQHRLQDEESRVNSMIGILKIFRRHSSNAQLDILRHKLAIAANDESKLLAKIESINNQRPPDNAGLDAQSKRAINFLIVAFAQHLFLQLGGSDFAVTVKETMGRGVEAVKYGDEIECNQMLERIAQKAKILKKTKDIGEELQKRAELLAERASFAGEQEIVPAASSVAAIFTFAADGSVAEVKGNILGENYWGIARVLSR